VEVSGEIHVPAALISEKGLRCPPDSSYVAFPSRTG